MFRFTVGCWQLGGLPMPGMMNPLMEVDEEEEEGSNESILELANVDMLNPFNALASMNGTALYSALLGYTRLQLSLGWPVGRIVWDSHSENMVQIF